MVPDPVAASRALLAAAAESMFDGVTLAPALDAGTARTWDLLGHLTAENALFGTQALGFGARVYYGFVAQHRAYPLQTIAVVRGTESVIEWMEDIEGFLVPWTAAGHVAHGFWSIYETLEFLPLAAAAGAPAARALGAAFSRDAVLTVIGHSLGGALATYLMADIASMAQPRPDVRGALFASPRAGDTAFVVAVDEIVGKDNYVAYAYIRDVVPHCPPSLFSWLGFQSLPNTLWIRPATACAVIRNDPKCNHSARSYAAMLDPDSVHAGASACVLAV